MNLHIRTAKLCAKIHDIHFVKNLESKVWENFRLDILNFILQLFGRSEILGVVFINLGFHSLI